jgi:hypothetical protein
MLMVGMMLYVLMWRGVLSVRGLKLAVLLWVRCWVLGTLWML